MGENRNFLLAAILSIAVLLVWQYLVIDPRVQNEQARRAAAEQTVDATGTDGLPTDGAAVPAPSGGAQTAPGAGEAGAAATREAALAASSRLPVDTPKLDGSISLQGGRLDDLQLKNYRETVDPTSPEIVLLSPPSAPQAYFAEFGWTATGENAPTVPGRDTVWQAPAGATLTPGTPVTLTYDNGVGLIFRRTVSVDADYMFTIEETVENRTGSAVTLYPYGLIHRKGTPATSGYYVLHEGLIGHFADTGLAEIDYDEIMEDREIRQTANAGWLGITDKYWAAVLIPDSAHSFTARFSEGANPRTESYQADYLLDGVTVPAGGMTTVTNKLFAGAKVVSIVDGYQEGGVENFDLLIDWGWFYFLTKPLFKLLDLFATYVGNFGIAILIVTVLIKLAFFPLANRSYESMSKMKKLQPEMMRLREVYKDDRLKQQQEMMEMYKREKVNPLAGCLPVVIQIPVFFALYKVLFVTIEMRHAPFFGWIEDLSAPDPTSLFNLFGLIPWDPPSFLMIGVWPIIMGLTMFVQMRMNPAPADPVQQQVFAWMPLVFTFLLGHFAAGLVIYWAWNNFLSVLQQGVIMRRQGVPIELFNNLGIDRLLRRDKSGSS